MGCQPVALVQYTEQHNLQLWLEGFLGFEPRMVKLIKKSAGRAPSLRVIPWHLPYNRGKGTEKLQSTAWKNLRQGIKPQSGYCTDSSHYDFEYYGVTVVYVAGHVGLNVHDT
jgi:hypothetical protein